METTITDFLCQIAIILFSTKMIGILMRKCGLPQVLGYIVAGVIIGPAVWEMFFDLGGLNVFPLKPNGYLNAFAEVGVIFVMFTAGLETNLEDVKKTGMAAFSVAMLGVLVPLGAGTLIGYLLLPDQSFGAHVFIGVIMTATSVGITVEVLRELGKLQTKVGTVVLSAAIIDDVLGIMVLSVVLSLSGTKSTENNVLNFINPNGIPIVSILWILAFFVFAVGAGVGFSKLFRFIEKKAPHTRRIPILSIALCFLYAFIAEKVFGVADITGAYIAGLVLSTNHASAQYVDRKVSINSYTIFAPIFFAGIGIKMSFADFDVSVLWFSLTFVAVAIMTKIIGCGGMAKMLKFGFKDSLRVGVGMIARGEVALIVMEKGILGGIIDAKYRVIVVMLVMVSSLLAPILLKLLYKKDDTLPLPTKTELEEGHFD